MTREEAIQVLNEYDVNFGYHTAYEIADAMMMAIEALEQEPKMGQWISVHKALPEDEVDVLVCSNTGNIEVARGSRSTEMEGEFIWYTSGWIFGKVIAWMPLPEPYKEDN